MRTKVFAVLALCVALGGCAARVKNVTDLPAGVTQKQAQDWDKAVTNLTKIAEVTSGVRQSVIAANKAGLFPDGPAYVTTLTVIGKVDQLQLAASGVLKQSPNNFSDTVKGQVQDYMNQIAAQIIILNTQGVTGIKDQTTLQKVNGLIGEISAATAFILSL